MEVEEECTVFYKENLSLEEALVEIRKPLSSIQRESEFLRKLEIGFGFCASNISFDLVQNELFRYICPVAEEFLIKKLKEISQEIESNSLHKSINVCILIVNNFTKFGDYGNLKIKLCNIESWLLSSIRMLYFCFEHCKKSEQIYGSRFVELAENLSGLFKKCCAFVEKLINVFIDNSCFEVSNNSLGTNEKEVKILGEFLTYLSRCGNVLFDLEIKTTAKVWKGFVYLLETNFTYIKHEYCIDETIENLCSRVDSCVNQLLSLKSQKQDLFKIVKLSSFTLKIIIKLCQTYCGHLQTCHDSLFKLLLSLVKCNISGGDEGTIAQLTVGTDPLMSLLMSDIKLVEKFRKENEKSSVENLGAEFCVLCCLICQKLVHCPANMRILWFNDGKNNVLDWLLQNLPNCQLYNFRNVSLPSVLVLGKQKKFSDVYEYCLVSASTFLMTMTELNFIIAEQILIRNILQKIPIKALFAMDIWCLLARFGHSNLCFSQTQKLLYLFLELKSCSLQMEKLYLKSLIQRLHVLLTENQRKVLKEEFPAFVACDLWAADGTLAQVNDFPLAETCFLNQSLLDTIFPFSVDKKLTDSVADEIICTVVGLWKFNCEVLLNCYQSIKYMKALSALTACIIPEASSEHLLLVLSQVRRVMDFKRVDVVLYLTWILNSLSRVRVPVDSSQKNIFVLIADVFRRLLLSHDVLVKTKSLETFYTFSHLTTHSNIIALTVQNSAFLKSEIADYLKKNFSSQTSFPVDGFLRKLFLNKHEHNCNLGSRTQKHCPVEISQVILRWKEDGENLMKNFNELTESQKNTLVILCSRIQSLLR